MSVRFGLVLCCGLVGLAAPAQAGDAKPTVVALIKTLEDPDKSAQTRRGVLVELARHGRKAEPAIGALKKILAGPPGAVDLRTEAVTALGAIGKPAVPTLLKGLSSENNLLRRHVMRTLGDIGLNAQEAIPTLLGWVDAALAKPGGAVDFETLTVLGQLNPTAKDFVPRAVKMIRVIPDHDPKRKARGDKLQAAETAAILLGDYGPEAKDAIPVLVRVLKMPDGTRYYLNLYTRVMAALGEMGPDAADALPALRAMLDRPGEAAKAAEQAIARIKAPRNKAQAKRTVWKSIEVTFELVKPGEWKFSDLEDTWTMRERRRRDEYLELVVVDGPGGLGDALRLYKDRVERRGKKGTEWTKVDEGSWADR